MTDNNRQGWLVIKRKPREIVQLHVPGRDRPIEVSIGEYDRGYTEICIRADRDIEISAPFTAAALERLEGKKDETTED